MKTSPKSLEGVFSLRGKLWRVLRTGKTLESGADGSCSRSKATIRVRKKLNGRRELETYLHEALHACFWDLDEEGISEAAQDISKMLRKLGYRRKPDIVEEDTSSLNK